MLVVVVELLLLLEGLFDKKATLTPSVEASPAWGCFQLVLSFKGVLFTSSTTITTGQCHRADSRVLSSLVPRLT